MKSSFNRLTIALLIVFAFGSFVLAQDTRDPLKIEIFKRFTDNRGTHLDLAYQAAKDYLQKYAGDKDKYTDYLQKWIMYYERDLAKKSADEIDNYVRGEMTAQHIPGLSLCVVHNGRIVKSAVYGLADVELNVPVTGDTEFSIASMTKSITASAIMLLVQDGKLSLDDHISKYFEGLPETWQPITIRHLLSHTSGIKDHFRDYPFYPPLKLDRKLEYTDEEYLKAHIDAGLNFTPGAQWAYCSSGCTLLGMMITKVTGKPYGDFFRDRIFAPLGMTRTHLISLKNIIPNRAHGYQWEDGALRNGNYTGQTYAGALM
jgi:CubicO group peptidase (beta-lactamase class C family)